MTRQKEKTYSIRFEPNGLKVKVPEGATILEAAYKAGIYISSICGGDGYCGKCKVIIEQGQYKGRPTDMLTPEEIKQHIVLACQTKVLSDMIITVPKSHSLDTDRILVQGDATRFSEMKDRVTAPEHEFDPLVRKLYLEMTPPSVHDHTADHERLYLAIRQQIEAPNIQTGFRVLQRLSSILQQSSYKVTATVGRRGGTTEVIEIEPGDCSRRNFGIAVDLGTTTVVAHLIDMSTGRKVDTEATYNSQINFGEDYIRRIIYAEQHNAFDQMQTKIVQDINGLISNLAERRRIHLHDITAIICAGNTAMTHFLLNLDSRRIRREPYVASADFVPPFRAAEVGLQINKRGLLYCLPSVAAYVGGDIVSGVLSTQLYNSEGISLLVDIGTNGEVVLGNREWMVCASSSAGPAFEGSGVKHGMRAAAGAIEAMSFNGDGTFNLKVVSDTHPIGICGSGLLDVLAELFTNKIIDRTGKFILDSDKRISRDEDGINQFTLVPAESSHHEVVINQIDIDNLIRSKAGVFAAINVLMESTQITADDLDCIYLAGGFGNYLNVERAITIGMLPEVPKEKMKSAGNTSIMGAKTALLSRHALETSQRIAKNMTYFDLMSHPTYMEEFIRACFLPHTDLSLFDSVNAAMDDLAKE